MRFCTSVPLVCASHLKDMGIDEVFRATNRMLVFRGTLSADELLREMRVGQHKWLDIGSVHKGFADMYERMRPELLEVVKKEHPHTIAGHSLGGVMAVLCAIDMVTELNMIPRNTITIGAPRIGSREFAENAVSIVPNIVRIANDNDFITRIPPLCVHVGVTTVRFQTHERSVLRNHALPTYCDALLQRRFTVESDALPPSFSKLWTSGYFEDRQRTQ